MFENAVNVKQSICVLLNHASNRSSVWGQTVHMAYSFRRILAGSDIFKQKDLSTRLTIKGFKGAVVNRALPSLH